MKLVDYKRQFFNCCQSLDESILVKIRDMLIDLKRTNNSIIFMGNGGSAGIASHFATDFAKTAKIPTKVFTDPALITCFSNDYGYENWLFKSLEIFASKGDVAIIISSSGESENILRAAQFCRQSEVPIIAFSGFKSCNRLHQVADINLHVAHDVYNLIENTHSYWLGLICDMCNGLIHD